MQRERVQGRPPKGTVTGEQGVGVHVGSYLKQPRAHARVHTLMHTHNPATSPKTDYYEATG